MRRRFWVAHKQEGEMSLALFGGRFIKRCGLRGMAIMNVNLVDGRGFRNSLCGA